MYYLLIMNDSYTTILFLLLNPVGWRGIIIA